VRKQRLEDQLPRFFEQALARVAEFAAPALTGKATSLTWKADSQQWKPTTKATQ
jgi:hypothetical protein